MQTLLAAPGQRRQDHGFVMEPPPNFKARCLLTLQTDKPPSNTTTEIPRELAGISDTDFMIDSAEMFGLDDSCFGMDLLGFDFNL